MTKAKHPLFSFGATGTVADTLTHRRSRGVNIAEKKPIPANPKSLLQTYQRWDYQLYCALWNHLTPAQWAAYRSLGARHHMTGFAYFMGEQLSTLPDLAARWHLDVIAGGITPDSSKNANHGTVFGANLFTGRIDKCLIFDGTDDYINCGVGASLNLGNVTDRYSMMAWVKTTKFGEQEVFFKTVVPQPMRLVVNTVVQVILWDGVFNPAASGLTPVNDGQWHHIIGAVDRIAKSLDVYVDGVHDGNAVDTTTGDIRNPNALLMGIKDDMSADFHGLIDEAAIYTRPMHLPERILLAERRYP